jgi:hypothetical protein
MALYVCREGTVATASAWQNLATLGGETRNAVIVPPGMNSIKEIWAVIDNAIYTNATGMMAAVKLKGAGIQGVDYETLVGGITCGTITSNTGAGWAMWPCQIKTNIAVTPGAEIWVQGCQVTGGDCGTPNIAVTLVFDSSGGGKRYSFVRFASCATVDTKYSALLDPTGATVNLIQLPQTARHITSLITCVGGVTLGAGNGGGDCLIRLESGCTEGVHEIVAGGFGTELATQGTGAGGWVPDQVPTDISVIGGASILVTAEQMGADWGTPIIGVAVEVE